MSAEVKESPTWALCLITYTWHLTPGGQMQHQNVNCLAGCSCMNISGENTDQCLIRHPKSQLDPSLPELNTLVIRSNSLFLHFVCITVLHHALAYCKQLLLCLFIDFWSTILCNWSNADYPYSQRAKEAVIRSGQVTRSLLDTFTPLSDSQTWR